MPFFVVILKYDRYNVITILVIIHIILEMQLKRNDCGMDNTFLWILGMVFLQILKYITF